MRLDQMKIFVYVLECGSIASAARRLHLSQPAVSMAIAAMEHELGHMLLFRTPGQRHPIKPTAKGNAFLTYARSALNSYQAMISELDSIEAIPQHFSVGITPGPGAAVAPLLIQCFKTIYPHIPFSINSCAGYEILKRLRDGEFDVVITGIYATGDDIIFDKFFYDPLVLICPVSFGTKGPISLHELKTLPLVVRSKSSNAMCLVLKELERVGLDLPQMNVIMQVYGNADVLQAVSLGACAGFVTRSILGSHHHNDNVVTVPVKKFHVDRYLHIVRKKDTYFGDGIRKFWELALDSIWREKEFKYDTWNLKKNDKHA